MKKFMTVVMVLVLCLAMTACNSAKDVEVPEDVVNPINVSISITDSTGEAIEITDFPALEKTPFIVEEGTNVLDATQIFCVSEDMEITLGPTGDYITSIGGVGEKDGDATTGWVFKVNGEMGNLSAKDEVLVEGDEISWEFIDFSSYTW